MFGLRFHFVLPLTRGCFFSPKPPNPSRSKPSPWSHRNSRQLDWRRRLARDALSDCGTSWRFESACGHLQSDSCRRSSTAKRCRQRRSRQFNLNIAERPRQRRGNHANKCTSNGLPVPALRPPYLSPFRLSQRSKPMGSNLSAARSLPCDYNQNLHAVFAHAPIVAQRLTGRVAGDGCGQNVL